MDPAQSVSGEWEVRPPQAAPTTQPKKPSVMQKTQSADWEVRPPAASTPPTATPATDTLQPIGSHTFNTYSYKPGVDTGVSVKARLLPDMTSQIPNQPPEGTYKFHGPDGKEVMVPYSKALEMLGHPEAAMGAGPIDVHVYKDAYKNLQKLGYTLDDKDVPRLWNDFNADSRLGGTRKRNEASSVPVWQSVVGTARQGARSLVGLHDIVVGGPKEGEQPSALRRFAETPQQNLFQSLGGGTEQVGELLLPEAAAGKILEGLGLAAKAPEGIKAIEAANKAYAEAIRLGKEGKEALLAAEEAAKASKALQAVPRAQTLTHAVGRATLEGTRAAAEQGTQQLVKSGGDLDQAREAAEFGGAAGGLSVLAPELLGAGGRFTRNILRHKLGVDELKGEELIAALRKENAAIDAEASKVHDENMAKIKKARDAGQEADAARIEHEDATMRHEALVTKQQNLSDALERSRQTVYSRLQNTKSAARAYFSQAYGEIEKAGGGKGVELETLVNDAEEAREHVKGSEDSLKVFNDLENRFNHPNVDLSKPPNSDFTKEEWTSFSKEDREHAWKDAMEEGGTSSTISLEDLNGYYSELGRVASSKSTPGDLKAAAKAMQKSIDERIEETYGEELFKKNQLVRSQYREFAGQFLDADSPVAKAVDAPDYYHGTQTTFLTSDARQPAVRSRVKTMLIGDAKDPSTQFLGKEIHQTYARDPETGKMIGSGETIPSWRYRRETHSMIEHMRNLHTGLEKTEAAAGIAGTMAGKTEEGLASARAAAREVANPKLQPVTPSTPISPADMRAARAKALEQSAHNLGKLGFWIGASGLVTGVGTFLKTGDLQKSLEIGGVGMAAGLVSPYVISKMLDQPGVIGSLTKLSRRDLENLAKLPPAERRGVEQTIRQLADSAVKSGRLRAEQIPWLRILGGEAGRQQAIKPVSPIGQSTLPAPLPTSTTGVPAVMPLPGEQPGVQP